MTATTDALIIALRAAERAIQPRRSISVSDWAQANRILSPEGSAEPGPWKNSRNPPAVEIMDQLSEDSPAHFVVFMKPSQWGGTEIASNWLGSIIDHTKGPTAVVMPTDNSLADWTSQKFDPLTRSTPAVAAAMYGRSNKAADNSAKRKRFVGGTLYFKTAGSTADLKATSLRHAIADELDEWDWTTTQGDPLGLLQVRLTAFHDHKLFAVSSPTLKDASRIEEAYESGDQRRYHVPCPACDELQHLKWANLRWQNHLVGAANNHTPRWIRHAWYACEHCGSEIQEHHKPQMLARGRWIPAAPGATHPSYHINALYTPLGLGRTWAELATEWLEAQNDNARLMRFMNTRLAETWADRTRDIKANSLQARAEPWLLGTIPPGCLVLTAGVDTQDDRLEIQILGHGRDTTATIDYHIIPGSPAEQSTWDALTAYLTRAWQNAAGRTLTVEATAIDSGGHHTHDVYQYVRSRAVRRCIACKGHSTPARIILGRPSRQDVNARGKIIKNGVSLYLIGADTAKHLLYQRLADDAEKPPAERKIRFPQDLESSYYDQLVSETYNPRKKRWEKKQGKRNEALDTWVLALAASHHPELYLHKWRASDWAARAAMLQDAAPESPAPTNAAAKPEDPTPAPPATSTPPATPTQNPNGEKAQDPQQFDALAAILAARRQRQHARGRR